MKKIIYFIFLILCVPISARASITEIQHPQTTDTTCSTTVATCTLTLTTATTTGPVHAHVGVMTITLLSSVNTWVTGVTDNLGDVYVVPGSGGSGGCYIFAGVFGTTGCAYNLALPVGVTSVTATWSQVVPEGAKMDFREYSYTGAALQLDNFGTAGFPSTSVTSITGITPTISGSNDVIIQSIATGSDHATAVSVYGNGNLGQLFYASADLLNTTSTTPPTFTMCCTTTVYAVMYIAFKEIGTNCPTTASYTNPTNPLGPLVTLSDPSINVLTCFYIAQGGSDSNSGTSEASPWQHAPGMPNCLSGSACHITPTAGEGFIFQGNNHYHFAASTSPTVGGVWTLTQSGNSTPTYIYMGVDPNWIAPVTGTVNTSGTSVTWETGLRPSGDFIPALVGQSITINGTNFTVASVTSKTGLTLTASAGTQTGVSFSFTQWGRVILDGDNPISPGTGGIVSSCTFPAAAGYHLFSETGVSYTIIDGFEFTGMCWNDAPNNSDSHDYLNHNGAGPSFLVSFRKFSNLYFHGWTHVAFNCTPGNPNTGICGNVISLHGNTQATDQGTLIDHTVVDGSDSDDTTMNAIIGDAYQFTGNVIRHVGGTTIINNCHQTDDNLFEFINNNQDGSTHSDMWFCIGEFNANSFTFRNVIRNVGTEYNQPLSAVLWFNPDNGNTDYIYDNVGYNVNCAGNCNNFEPTPTGIGQIFNNTWQSNATTVWKNSGTNSTYTTANNHYITPQGTGCAAVFDKTSNVNGGDTSCSGDTFMTPATAATQGYTTANNFAPTSNTNSTVGAGTNEFAQVVNFGPAFASSTTNGCNYNSINNAVTCPVISPVVRWTSTLSPGGDTGAYQFTSSTPFAGTPSCIPSSGVVPQTVNCSVTGGAPVMCFTTNGSTPATNGASGCTTGTLYTGAITISVASTLRVIAGGTGFLDGTVAPFTYTPSSSPVVPGANGIMAEMQKVLHRQFVLLGE